MQNVVDFFQIAEMSDCEPALRTVVDLVRGRVSERLKLELGIDTNSFCRG